ncbi:hypothetical protein DMB66_24430 [Actinoplanes sp. ATCC 53533]|uniref:hypothetical protein n=1 Tax=Actinoplanes sp. ATCC 53533 TaxID=1288362 RepID=UPI000F773D8A|nr:hypothetical protein [Actinoplanes sp. ATCC 53533]RSM61662.1 hypothetical protein DMB66_24430 [Actinoplanes sp. ATCC 53533]
MTAPDSMRRRSVTVDQTVIRSAGTAGMPDLSFLVDAAPTQAFAGAGAFLVDSSVAARTGRQFAEAAGRRLTGAGGRRSGRYG